MFRAQRPFLITLACTWISLILTAWLYSKLAPVSLWIWAAALPAFIIETLFYLGSVFENTRAAFARLGVSRVQAGLLWASAVIPYLVFSVGAGTFQRNAFYLLALLSAVLAFWHALFPRRIAYDAGFLVIAAAPLITHVFSRIYRAPDHDIRVDILGHLMWIRVGLIALLVLRQWRPGPVSLWPKRREWRIGALWFVVLSIPLVLLALGMHDVQLAAQISPWWRIPALAAGTFVGFGCVSGLGEELFFRGVVQRALLNTWRSPFSAVLLSSLLFGSVHLWFHQFPNWRAAIVAAILGIGCGFAYAQTGSIRASMVTHAFAVATLKTFFRVI